MVFPFLRTDFGQLAQLSPPHRALEVGHAEFHSKSVVYERAAVEAALGRSSFSYKASSSVSTTPPSHRDDLVGKELDDTQFTPGAGVTALLNDAVGLGGILEHHRIVAGRELEDFVERRTVPVDMPRP